MWYDAHLNWSNDTVEEFLRSVTLRWLGPFTHTGWGGHIYLSGKREINYLKFVHFNMQDRTMRFGKISPTNVNWWYKVGEILSFEPIILVVKQIISRLNCILDNHNGRCYSIIRLSWHNSIAITLCLPELTSQDGRATGVWVESKRENAGNMHWWIRSHKWCDYFRYYPGQRHQACSTGIKAACGKR